MNENLSLYLFVPVGLCVREPAFVDSKLCPGGWEIAFRLHSVLVANIQFLITGFGVKSVWLLIFLPASVPGSLEQIVIRDK